MAEMQEWSPDAIRNLGLRLTGGRTWGWQCALARAVGKQGPPCLPQDVHEFVRRRRRVPERIAEALDMLSSSAPPDASAWTIARLRRLGLLLAGGDDALVVRRLRSALNRRGYQTTRERLDDIIKGRIRISRQLVDALDLVEGDFHASPATPKSLVADLGCERAEYVAWTPKKMEAVGRRLDEGDWRTALFSATIAAGCSSRYPVFAAIADGKKQMTKPLASALAVVVQAL